MHSTFKWVGERGKRRVDVGGRARGLVSEREQLVVLRLLGDMLAGWARRMCCRAGLRAGVAS